MAQIVLSLAELVGALRSNDAIPEQIGDIKTEADSISFRLRIDFFPVASIPVTIKYVDFVNSDAVFEITVGGPAGRLDGLVRRLLQLQPLAEYVSSSEYPKVHINVNTALARRVEGIRVETITFEDGKFHIVTHND